MVTVDKLELLDKKVKEAVSLILELRQSNAGLKEENDRLVKKLSELEKLTETIQDDQNLIEVTIQEAIEQLDKAGTMDDDEADDTETEDAPGSLEEDEEDSEEEKSEENKTNYYSAEDNSDDEDSETEEKSVDVKELYQSEDEGDEGDEELSGDDETEEDDDLFSSSEEEPPKSELDIF